MSRRFLLVLSLTLFVMLVVAPAAFGIHRVDGGEGLYGETDDKVVTNAGFILIAAFPLLCLLLSLAQWRLDKRKEARKRAAKVTAARGDVRAGW
jgi:preprotein translocase subunit SecG